MTSTNTSTAPICSVLRHLDPIALRPAIVQEARSRQRHLPPVSVYRWWARRTETVTGAVVDAVSADHPGRLLLADAFAGGGVIALAGLLRGHRVYAQDVNPWAAKSLATMLSLPSASQIEAAGERLRSAVAEDLAAAYGTELSDGTPAQVSHTLRVARATCPTCSETIRLFPSALVSLATRVDAGGTQGWMACRSGHLTFGPATKRTRCGTCGCYVYPRARYTSNRETSCRQCGWSGKLVDLVGQEPLGWEPVLVERCGDGRREIGEPSDGELAAADDRRWRPQRDLGLIADGIETAVLLRHGLTNWHDLYPARQRVLVERMLEACLPASDGDQTVHEALQTAVIGSTEMAGLASRWDGRYLKAYETLANHRFNFTTLTAEPNMWGAPESGRGTVDRRIAQLSKAAVWLGEHMGRPLNVDGPRLATDRRTRMAAKVDARVVAGGSQRLLVPTGSLDAVITDPPYHDDVHYGELSDLFRAWAGERTGSLEGDAIVRRLNGSSGTDAYQQLLIDVFAEARRALKAQGHLVLSYANRHPGAWVALLNALQAAGFRAVGYTVVQSENEIDHSKAGRRACTLDVLIDLVLHSDGVVVRHEPNDAPTSDEERYCRLIGAQAMQIGELGTDWEESFKAILRASAFLATKAADPAASAG